MNSLAVKGFDEVFLIFGKHVSTALIETMGLNAVRMRQQLDPGEPTASPPLFQMADQHTADPLIPVRCFYDKPQNVDQGIGKEQFIRTAVYVPDDFLILLAYQNDILRLSRDGFNPFLHPVFGKQPQIGIEILVQFVNIAVIRCFNLPNREIRQCYASNRQGMTSFSPFMVEVGAKFGNGVLNEI